MATDSKYGQLHIPGIPEDEPVVVFRAQDRLAVPTLCHYLDLCAQASSPPHHIDALEQTIETFRRWSETHPTQTPRSASR